MTDNYRFKAFISYSHADRTAADRLLRDLENYRLPKKLTDALGLVGEQQQKIGRMFRDREELPAAEDLSTEVKKALAQSEFMIVLCSPMAAASRWVNREIIEFKKLTGERRVLSVILSGEPFSSNKGEPQQECLPPALRFKLGKHGRLTKMPAEPLAADFRKNGDGHRHGFLKIVAGLMNVGLDALVERDLQRKMRRVMAVTVASILAMIGMSLLTFEAISARRAAEFHQSEAESLIEFMLTDLKEKLEPVGRLDVLDAVGDRAVSYYENQIASDASDDALGRRARAFHLVGTIQQTQSNLGAAQAMFEKAKEFTLDLLVRDPSNPKRIFEHSQSVYWVGSVDWARGNFEAAEAAFREYKDLAEQLVTFDPANSEWMTELAYAESNLGTVLLRQRGKPEQALTHFEKALVLFQQLSEASPQDRSLLRDLADAHSWTADTIYIVGTLNQVMTHRVSEVSIYEHMVTSDLGDMRARRDMLTAQRLLAYAHQLRGNYSQAIELLSSAMEEVTNLVAFDPENDNWREQAAYIGLYLANAYLGSGQYDNAARSLHTNKPEIMALMETGDTLAWRTIELDYWHKLLSVQIAFATGDYEIARAAGADLIAELLTSQHYQTPSPRFLYILAGARVAHGDALAATQNLPAARVEWQIIIDELSPVYATQLPETKQVLAKAYARNGDTERAQEITSALLQQGFHLAD